MCPNYNLSGNEDPAGDFHPAENDDGKEISPANIQEDPREKKIQREDGDGELFPVTEFSIVIPTTIYAKHPFRTPKMKLHSSWLCLPNGGWHQGLSVWFVTFVR